MVLQEKIPTPQPSAIASYNYVDLAENTGITQFYLCEQGISGNTSYILTQNKPYSTSREINISDTSQTFSLTAFNLPQNIKGTAYLNIGRKTSVGTGAVKATLINNVTGNIVSATSPDTIGTAANVWLIPMTVPLTHFKSGEILQLKIEDQNAGTLFIGVDPQNRDGTNIVPSTDPITSLTASSIFIPFKLKT